MNWLRYVCLLIGAVLHVIAFRQLLDAGPVELLYGSHLVGSLIWGYGAAQLLNPAQHRLWWMLALCSLLFPVLGPVASLMLIKGLLRPPVRESPGNYVVWNERAAGRGKGLPATEIAAQSIVEILQSPQPLLRRNAVLALRNLNPQLAIPLLRKGLQDSDEQVRIYSQNILAGILAHFENRIKGLEQLHADQPVDASTAMRLAEHYYELVYLDVAGDSEAETHSLNKAIKLLEAAHRHSPNDRKILLHGLKYTLRLGDTAAARQWLQRFEPLKFDPAHMLPWKLEIAYLEHDWTGLQSHFAEFRDAKSIIPRLSKLDVFWCGQKEAAA